MIVQLDNGKARSKNPLSATSVQALPLELSVSGVLWKQIACGFAGGRGVKGGSSWHGTGLGALMLDIRLFLFTAILVLINL